MQRRIEPKNEIVSEWQNNVKMDFAEVAWEGMA